jgi:hypothetical protein
MKGKVYLTSDQLMLPGAGRHAAATLQSTSPMGREAFGRRGPLRPGTLDLGLWTVDSGKSVSYAKVSVAFLAHLLRDR